MRSLPNAWFKDAKRSQMGMVWRPHFLESWAETSEVKHKPHTNDSQLVSWHLVEGRTCGGVFNKEHLIERDGSREDWDPRLDTEAEAQSNLMQGVVGSISQLWNYHIHSGMSPQCQTPQCQSGWYQQRKGKCLPLWLVDNADNIDGSAGR